MLNVPLLILLHALVVIVYSARIIYRRLPTSTSTAWILVIAALPILGLFFYIFFGDQKLSRRR
ncbi:MAG: cardiolipin synthase A, partial [Winogradskyella sp.]|uniref:PLDc N-terminal domain-containing protein n=1 Tax=Winogradskyella sp. TaxID=1883156 RepID=UPI00184823DD|nr:cardiolipin synthase A [Winogradskyella sp.]